MSSVKTLPSPERGRNPVKKRRRRRIRLDPKERSGWDRSGWERRGHFGAVAVLRSITLWSDHCGSDGTRMLAISSSPPFNPCRPIKLSTINPFLSPTLNRFFVQGLVTGRCDNDNRNKYVCITTNRLDSNSNPKPNPTRKQNAVMNI